MPRLPLDSISAVIFDMDGVITRTAEVHAGAWKETFDEVLEAHARRIGEPQAPFDPRTDYLRHVDGKPRRDGIRDFLRARAIELTEGEEGDRGVDTVEGIARLKNERFQALLEREGAAAYPSTLRLIESLRERGVRVAVISSSRNARAVLDAAGVRDRFEAEVTGIESGELGLPGKPAPDIFLEAARRLGVPARRAAVVEDAESGVRAGRAGGFAVVIGVDRGGNAESLAAAGADIVVGDLGEIELTDGHTERETADES